MSCACRTPPRHSQVEPRAAAAATTAGGGAVTGGRTATLGDHAVGAMVGAVAGAVVVTPMEMVKTNAQVTLRRGLKQEVLIARHVLQTKGIAGLYRGFWAMAASGGSEPTPL